jgi:hypothetical protein
VVCLSPQAIRNPIPSAPEGAIHSAPDWIQELQVRSEVRRAIAAGLGNEVQGGVQEQRGSAGGGGAACGADAEAGGLAELLGARSETVWRSGAPFTKCVESMQSTERCQGTSLRAECNADGIFIVPHSCRRESARS